MTRNLNINLRQPYSQRNSMDLPICLKQLGFQCILVECHAAYWVLTQKYNVDMPVGKL